MKDDPGRTVRRSWAETDLHVWKPLGDSNGQTCMKCGVEITDRDLVMMRRPSQMLNARCADRYRTSLGILLPVRPSPENCLRHVPRPLAPRELGRWRCQDCGFLGICDHGIEFLCSDCGAAVYEIRQGFLQAEESQVSVARKALVRRDDHMPRRRMIELE